MGIFAPALTLGSPAAFWTQRNLLDADRKEKTILELLDGFQDQKAWVGKHGLRVALGKRHRPRRLGDFKPNPFANRALLSPKAHQSAPNSRKNPNQSIEIKVGWVGGRCGESGRNEDGKGGANSWSSVTGECLAGNAEVNPFCAQKTEACKVKKGKVKERR